MLLNEGEQGTHDLHLGDGDDLIKITATELECERARRLDSAAVGNGIGGGERDELSSGERRLHAGGVFRLDADDLHMRVDELCSKGYA